MLTSWLTVEVILQAEWSGVEWSANGANKPEKFSGFNLRNSSAAFPRLLDSIARPPPHPSPLYDL